MHRESIGDNGKKEPAEVTWIGNIQAHGPVICTGTATGGSATIINIESEDADLQEDLGPFDDGEHEVAIVGGTGEGQCKEITDMDGTAVIVGTDFSPEPDATSVYEIRRTDYSDQRYWVERERPTNDDDEDTSALETEPYAEDHHRYRFVTATNKAEDADPSHFLEPGTRVEVHEVLDRSSPQIRKYWFTLAAAAIVYAGGHFNAAGTKRCMGAAVWNGRWRALMSDPLDTLGVPVNDFIVCAVGNLPRRLYAAIDGTVLADGFEYRLVWWDDENGRWEGISGDGIGSLNCLAFKDGILYAAGSPVRQWNGSSWSDVGGGGPDSGQVYDMLWWDADLYVVGEFQDVDAVYFGSIARWDGAAWNMLSGGGDVGLVSNGPGPNGTGYALKLFDDGTGEKMYVCGPFHQVGGLGQVYHIARWTGSVWEKVGGGWPDQDDLRCMAVYDVAPMVGEEGESGEDLDDGAGAQLYIGGDGTFIRWDGAAWATVAEPFDGGIHAMAVFRGELYVGGTFDAFDAGVWSAGGRVVRYETEGDDAPLFVGLGAMNGAVRALAFHDGALLAAGSFTVADGADVHRIARWREMPNPADAAWQSVVQLSATARALAVSGDDIYAGGDFTSAGGIAAHRFVRIRNGLPQGVGGLNGPVYALRIDGSELLIGGQFTLHDGAPAVNCNAVVMFDTSSDTWSAMGDGMDRTDGGDAIVKAIIKFGSDWIACGNFQTADGNTVNHIARWDGAEWVALGTGLNAEGRCMAVVNFGAGDRLIVGGAFTTAGGTAVNYIAQWDGANWSALGAGQPDRAVDAIAAFSDGGTNKIAIDGYDGSGAGSDAATWDGSNWATLTGDFDGEILAIAYGSAGLGARLYFGGDFSGAGDNDAFDTPTNRLMKYAGEGWQTVAGGVGYTTYAPLGLTGGAVFALLAEDVDGRCQELMVGGSFRVTNDCMAESIAVMTPRRWRGLGVGLRGAGVEQSRIVNVMRFFDDGSGRALYVGGEFFNAVNLPDRGIGREILVNNIARWRAGAWEPLGATPGLMDVVYGMCAHDDGVAAGSNPEGERLHVCGWFTDYVAVWDGDAFSAVGSGGLTDPDLDPRCLASFDGNLWLGGQLNSQTTCVWRWNGAAWSTASPFNGAVFDLIVADIGLGAAIAGGGHEPVLIAGGTSAGTSAVAYRVAGGSSWTALGSNLEGTVERMWALSGTTGRRLVVVGALNVGGADCLAAEFDGTDWIAMNTTADGFGMLKALRAADRDNALLYVGGGIAQIDSIVDADNVITWNRDAWGKPVQGGVNGLVQSMCK